MALTSARMSEAQFNELRAILCDRAGILFPDSRKSILETRLSRRLEELELDTFDQYLLFLSAGPHRDEEFQELFNRITINETSFFRNEPQLDVFEGQVLPRLLEARRDTRRLRIWSAACSSGEEPYTLAMQVHRTLGVCLTDWTIEILGTDISEKVLQVARAGRYAGYSVRGVNPLVLKRYFAEKDGIYELDPTVRCMVHFELLNLKDTEAAGCLGMFDVIFCRNVMIYFDDAMKRRCAQMFHHQLAADGTLFIGHSESLRNLDAGFEQVPVPQAFMYRKTSAAVTERHDA